MSNRSDEFKEKLKEKKLEEGKYCLLHAIIDFRSVKY